MQSHLKTSVVTDASRSILDTYKALAEELCRGLALFRETAETILHGSTIHLMTQEPDDTAIHKHFFTALFLYSYYRAGILPERRIIYTALNQCLRGMVTGCDNLLDDEYKVTLDTDLPASSRKFRSIIDIMVSNRAVASILDKGFGHTLSRHELIEATFESLRTLTISMVESTIFFLVERLGVNKCVQF